MEAERTETGNNVMLSIILLIISLGFMYCGIAGIYSRIGTDTPMSLFPIGLFAIGIIFMGISYYIGTEKK